MEKTPNQISTTHESEPIQNRPNLSVWKNFGQDLPAGLVVFLVALPLCLGIALASAPEHIFSGILAGIIGGLVIPFISRSPLSVSGPAAGLIAIVIVGIEQSGSFEAFLVAVFLGGILQILLGLVKAGSIAYFFPTSVIKGMLSAIGVILILKQLPHAVGYDVEAFDFQFNVGDLGNTFTILLSAFEHVQPGALIISLVSLPILILWVRTPLAKVNWLPSALIVVVLGVVINQTLSSLNPEWVLLGGADGHLVNLPKIDGFKGFLGTLVFPDFSALSNSAVWVTALTIGLVASVETLLSVEAVDKLDPHRRISPLNRELLAQGVANTFAGLLGALPITAVIVRSSANVNSGGQTRMSAFIHGIFLFGSVITIGAVLNMIPLASLACILLMIGYKLAHPNLFKKMYAAGWNQFVPFVATVVAVLATDLLKGIAFGTLVGIFFTIRANFQSAISVRKEPDTVFISFNKDVSFMNKALLSRTLLEIEDVKKVVIDGTLADFIDKDIVEIIKDYEVRAEEAGVEMDVLHVSPEVDTHRLSEPHQREVSVPQLEKRIPVNGNGRAH